MDEAQVEVQIAIQLDPLSLIVHEGLGYIQKLRRDYDAAYESYRRLMDMDPLFYKSLLLDGPRPVPDGALCGGD